MATQLPSTGAFCDTSDLLMIHTFYRKVYTDAPALVAAVDPANPAQLTAVADHIDDISQSLHAHHHGEDVLLWDQLASRAPACALHVGQMREQHAVVAALLETLDSRVLAWRASGSSADRDSVSAAVERVRGALFDHLGQEEEKIVPVAQQVMPQKEWDKLGEHGRSSGPRDRQLLHLGHILSSMSPHDALAWQKANLPAPVRLLWRLVGKRQFDAQAKAMRA